MATKISQYDANPANNTDLDGINLSENVMVPSDVNDALRMLMAHLKDMDAGTEALTALQVTGTVTANAFSGDGSSLTGVGADLVDDTTPQLGGNLDLNSNDITGTGDIDVTGTVTADGLTVDGIAVADDFKAISNTPTVQLLSPNSSNGYQLLANVSDSVDGGISIQDVSESNAKRFNIANNGDISFYDSTGVTQGLFWDSSTQRLGLGTTSPDNALDVKSTGTAYGTGYIVSRHMNSSGTKGVFLGYDADETAGTIGGANALTFQTYSGGWDERMRIDASGNVGIGTTSPSKELHVKGDIDIEGDTGGVAVLRFKAEEIHGTVEGINIGNNFGGLAFKTNQNGTTSERMRIDSSGNVGIGTTSPTGGRLVVAQSNSVQPAIHLPTDESTIQGSNTDTQIRMGGNLVLQGGGVTSIRAKNASGRIDFSTGSTPTERMRIDSSGNLLVGKTTTSAATNGVFLSASGGTNFVFPSNHYVIFNRNASGAATLLDFRVQDVNKGSISFNGTGISYNTSSDYRLKTDIAPIADATEKLMAMNAVSHRWKADPDADAVVGFIAQEMQEIVPEAVSGSADSDEMMGMDYGRITPVLVAALQDAHKKIEQLEQRIANMENN